MSAPAGYIAFFDLDHTILTTSSGKLYLRHVRRKGGISVRELAYGLIISYLYRMGFIDTETIVKRWALKYRGRSEKGLIEFSNSWFSAEVPAYFRKAVVDEIRRHQAEGARTVILSAATPYVCIPTQRHLGMDDVISSRLEVVDGKFTGYLDGPYCYGKEKLARAHAYCAERGYRLEDAWYYGDSFADLHVLERVRVPVCVAPDARLRKAARARGWRIIA